MKLLVITLLIIIALTDVTNAYTGVSGLGILALDIGAMPVGLASAYTSVKGNIECLGYNPAGIVGVNRQLSVMYRRWLADMNYGTVLYSRGNIGLGIVYFNGGDIEINYSDRPSEIKKAEQDILVVFGSGKVIWGLGMNFKYVYSVLAEEVWQQAVVLDIGKTATWRIFNRDIDFGLVIKNLGYGLRGGGKSSAKSILPFYIPIPDLIPRYYDYDYLPLELNLGLSTDMSKKVKILTDVDYKVNDFMIQQGVGVQYKVSSAFDMLGGIRYGDKMFNISGGMVFRRKNYEVDYSFLYNYDLGLTHLLNLVTRI
jgi:hypothetical protein